MGFDPDNKVPEDGKIHFSFNALNKSIGSQKPYYSPVLFAISTSFRESRRRCMADVVSGNVVAQLVNIEEKPAEAP